jgi:tetratricopeptide (TPR) repeat protein
VVSRLQQYFDSNDYDGARSFLYESLQHASLSPVERSYLYYHLGRIDFYEGKINDAEQLMRSALRENHDHLYAKVYLAKIAMEQGKSDVALSLFARLMKQEKNMNHLADFTTELLAAVPCSDSDLESMLVKNDSDFRDHSLLPKVSVFILCYNGLHYTQRCIHTLFENTQYPNFEVIVVDNASSDDTPAWLETYTQRVMFIRSAINRGFIGGNNFAAQYATGDLLVFLNNDTEVQQNWMTELVECFQRDAQVGAAGAMLIYPNGKLQEAGGIIFSDGTGLRAGR